MKIIVPVDENVPYVVVDLRDCRSKEVFYDEKLVDIYNSRAFQDIERNEFLDELYYRQDPKDFFLEHSFSPKDKSTEQAELDQEKKDYLEGLYSKKSIDFFSKYMFLIPKKELLNNAQLSAIKNEGSQSNQVVNQIFLDNIVENLSNIKKAERTFLFWAQKKVFEKISNLVVEDCQKILEMKREDNPELAIYIQQSMMRSEIERGRIEFIPLTENEIVIEDRFENEALVSIKDIPDCIKDLQFEDPTDPNGRTIPADQKDVELKFLGKPKKTSTARTRHFEDYAQER